MRKLADPIYLLGLLAVVAPFNVKVTVEPWTGLQLRLLVVCALMISVGLAIASLRDPKRRLTPLTVLAGLWLIGMWLAALTSNNPLEGSTIALRTTLTTLLIPATAAAVHHWSSAHKILRALAIGCSAAIGVAYVIMVFGLDFIGDRVFVGNITQLGPESRLTYPWPHANVAAMAIGGCIVTAACLRNRVLAGLSLVLLTVGLVLTISRGGALVIVAIAIAWILFRRRKTETTIVLSLVLVGVVTIALSAAWQTRLDQPGESAFYSVTITAPQNVSGEDDVLISISNTSASTFEAQGERNIRLSGRWLNDDEWIVAESFWDLNADIEPGSTGSILLQVDPPVPPGEYQIQWDLLLTDTAYFNQFLGRRPVRSSAFVPESNITTDMVEPYPIVPPSLQLGRVGVWKLALREFAASPLTGVGPQQIGDATAATEGSTKRVAGSHAHNVVLEPLVSWGLLGALPFLAILFLGARRAIMCAWRTRELLPTVVATSLIAILVHGIVDWPLVVTSTAIPVGILFGLAHSRLFDPAGEAPLSEAPLSEAPPNDDQRSQAEGTQPLSLSGLPLTELDRVTVAQVLSGAAPTAVIKPAESWFVRALVILTAPLWVTVTLLLMATRLVLGRRPLLVMDLRTGHQRIELYVPKIATATVSTNVRRYRGLVEVSRSAPTALDVPSRFEQWLRSSGLDELPQLALVAAGTMRLVGPRPVSPAETAELTDAGLPIAADDVHPGIVGLWQILDRHRYELSERQQLDMAMLAHWSPRLQRRVVSIAIAQASRRFLGSPPTSPASSPRLDPVVASE